MKVWGRPHSAIDWIEKHSEGVERLAKLEWFERQLFLDLGECYHPSWTQGRSRRLRIEGWDEPEFHVDGLLDTVQLEIAELRWCLPLWEENARLYQIELEKAREQRETVEHAWTGGSITVPREVRKWIDATTMEEPEAA
jgi:hypothetical protein